MKSSPVAEAKAHIGRRLDDYLITEFIDAGQFGLVFKGVDINTHKPVALKILSYRADRDAEDEFFNEDQILSRLWECDNVVRRIASGTCDVEMMHLATGALVSQAVPYIVFELAEGCLGELLVERNRLEWSEKLRLYQGIVHGVHEMHLRRIVHRDIKASNCLLFVRGQMTIAKTGDLGRARDLAVLSTHSPTDYIMGRGDLRFAPPEMLWLQGTNDAHGLKLADTYALGSLLFEIATGHGITAIALGSGPNRVYQMLKMKPEKRRVHFEAQVAAMRSRFASAIDMFRSELPPSIASQAAALVGQLCDPLPERRLPKGWDPVRQDTQGLSWLLQRIKVLRHLLAKSESAQVTA